MCVPAGHFLPRSCRARYVTSKDWHRLQVDGSEAGAGFCGVRLASTIGKSPRYDTAPRQRFAAAQLQPYSDEEVESGRWYHVAANGLCSLQNR